MKIHLHSIGCRLNHSEMERMARQLLAAGHELVDDTAVAEKVIINTCAVTSEAARDARSLTRRIHRQNDTAEIYLTGCYATIAPQELAQVAGATAVVPNEHKAQLVQRIDPTAPPEEEPALYDREPILREFHAGTASHTRAFIKVQDGCNNKCTFCVTTIARGAEKSRHLGDIVAEIQALTRAGYREAVLTGVHLGSYGHDFGNQAGLRDLVQAILHHTDIPRLRLSSLEPWEIADGFFELWQDSRLLPHLHLPLQSGSDRILQKMARRTKRSSFRALVHEARAHIPQLNLTSDLIVGFPSETDADFEQTLDFTREMGFSRVHAFTYSRRPGTAAAKMSGHLPKAVKKERVNRLLSLTREMGLRFNERYVGETVNVLWESAVGADENGLKLAGYTDNYVRVVANAPAQAINNVGQARIHTAEADGLLGVGLMD